MLCRDNNIQLPLALWPIFTLLSLLAIFPLGQLAPKNASAQSTIQHLQEVNHHQRLSATTNRELKDYYDYRRLDIRNS